MDKGVDYSIKKIQVTALQRFKNQNALLKEFGENGLKVYKEIDNKKTAEEIRNKVGMRTEKFVKIIDYMEKNGMVELVTAGGVKKTKKSKPAVEEEPEEEIEEETVEEEPEEEEEIEEPKKKMKIAPEEEEELEEEIEEEPEPEEEIIEPEMPEELEERVSKKPVKKRKRIAPEEEEEEPEEEEISPIEEEEEEIEFEEEPKKPVKKRKRIAPEEEEEEPEEEIEEEPEEEEISPIEEEEEEPKKRKKRAPFGEEDESDIEEDDLGEDDDLGEEEEEEIEPYVEEEEEEEETADQSSMEKIIRDKYGAIGLTVYQLIDGEKSAEEIMKETGLTESKLIEILDFMEEKGIIKLEYPDKKKRKKALKSEKETFSLEESTPFKPLEDREMAPMKTPRGMETIDVPTKLPIDIVKSVQLKAKIMFELGDKGSSVFEKIDGKRSVVDIVLETKSSLEFVIKAVHFLLDKNAIFIRPLSREEIEKKFGVEAYRIYKKFGREGVLLYELIGKDITIKEMMKKITKDKEKFIEMFIFVHDVLGVPIPVEKDILMKRLDEK